MQARGPFEFYKDVPRGAVLEVWEELEEGAVRIDAKVFSTAGDDDGEEWGAPQLLRTEQAPNQAGRKTLQADGYVLRVSTFFQNDVQGKLHVRVLKAPGGAVHSKPWFWPLEGEQAGDHLAGLFIRMAPAAADNVGGA